MTNEMAVPVAVQFDVESIDNGIVALHKLAGAASEIRAGFVNTFQTVENSITSAVASVENLIVSLENATAAVSGLVTELSSPSYWDIGVDVISIGLDTLSTFWEPDDAQKIVKGFGEGIFNVATTAGGLVKNAFGALREKIDFSVADVMDSVALSGGGGVVAAVKKPIGAITDYVAAVKSAAPEVGAFSAMFPKLSASLSTAGTAISSGVGKFASSIGSGFGKISSLLNGTTLIWGAVIAVVIAGVIAIIYYWDEIKGALGTAAEWVNTKVIQPFVNIVTQGFNSFMAIAQNVISFVQNLFATFTGYLQNAFATDWTEQFGAFGHILNAFFANVQNIWEAVKQIFTGVVNFVKSIFAGDWKAAWNSVIEIFGGIWDGMLAYVKMPINGIIGLINLLIRGAVDGINAVIGLINNLQFDIPDWIPKIGGTTFGFNIAPITAPQIPYLAQGAVLPANKPFLAMVGDQKHGTNVEAPLATIQEALANVLAQQGMGGDIHITFTGDLAQLGRVLKPVIERENRRVGTSLVKGVM